MEFEWDENKARQNLAKHKIDFVDAIRVFLDPFRIETIDEREDYLEMRLKVMGKVRSVLLVVIYTEREQKCRIISARRATKNERRIYENYSS